MYNYSFIIPHKNSPSLLQRCVDSIPERNDVQIIVLDDNSDDDKKPSLTRSNTKVVLLGNGESKGAGYARNEGIKNAEGKWLLFSDADDYYSANLLEYLDEHKDSDVDVIYFNYNRISKNGIKQPCTIIEGYSGSKNDLDIIKYRTNAPWNKMVRKDFVLDNHIEFEETVNGNDMFFTYQIGFIATKVSVDKNCIYNYDTSVSGMTNKKKNSKEYYICRLNHWYQANEFFSFVGHPEWKSPIPKRLMAVLAKKGLNQFVFCLRLYARYYTSIISNKSLFVVKISELESLK